MTDRELMQQALDALDLHAKQYPHMVKGYTVDAAEALRARLAQPEPEELAALEEAMIEAWKPVSQLVEPEPVAWHEPGAYGNVTVHEKWATENGWLPLYTAPPQREWQGLTDEDIKTMWDNHIIPVFNKHGISPFVFARAIEAKLKEKNA